MLCAKQKLNRPSVTADSQRKSDGPFFCPECSREVVLRTGSVRITHFAHRVSDICRYGAGETDDHRRCKKAIYEALLREPGVKNVILEHSLKTARPDVSAEINNVPVAIEVQISTLSMETIIRRTEEYARQGIYVLWLLPWTPYLDGRRYSPKLWEKWIHAAYFGRVYLRCRRRDCLKMPRTNKSAAPFPSRRLTRTPSLSRKSESGPYKHRLRRQTKGGSTEILLLFCKPDAMRINFWLAPTIRTDFSTALRSFLAIRTKA